MSFDTYLNLVFGVILVLVISIIIAIIQAKTTRTGRKQIRHFKCLILLLLGLLPVLTIIFLLSSFQQKKATYNQYIDYAYIDLDAHDYLSAAEHYNLASAASYDLDTRLKATYGEGMCFFLYATEDYEPQYYQNAAKIYTAIIKTPEYSNSKYYIDAVADMSSIYYFTNYSADNTEWIEIIERLESSSIASKKIQDISTQDDLSLKLKTVLALGLYYEHATYSSLDNLKNTKLSSKALMYFDEFNTLYHMTVESEGSISVSKLYTGNIINISDFLLTYGIFSNEPTNYFNAAIKLCETELDRVNIKNIKPAEYFNLKKNIGKGLIFLSYAYDDQKNVYLEKAYQILSPLIGFDDEDARTALLDIGYYLVMTNLCSNEELDRILGIYASNIQPTSTVSDASSRCKILLSACTVCRWIVDNYEYSSSAIVNGLHYADVLNTELYDFLNDDDQNTAEEFYNFFHNHSN
ncbi:hypothetical protein [Oscillibacter sp.]|uniref:hypothetical protein n=1 Tax=Oscillibacter sp. TaxID=1945593 RepID=UPI0026002AA5|nr:hypothetical protein [Oscillibacter sp.]